jgi:hypothetical protein
MQWLELNQSTNITTSKKEVEFEIGKGLKHEFKYVVKGFYFILESIHKLKFNILNL